MSTNLAIKHSRNGGTDRVEALIRNREPFKVASVEATTFSYGAGRLRGSTLDDFYADVRAGVDYVIYSYATPIAWHLTEPDSDGVSWRQVWDKFSPTTTQHQSRVRSALSGHETSWGTHVARPSIEYKIAGR